MYCINCGKEIADNSNFCRYCGNKIVDKSDKSGDRLKFIVCKCPNCSGQITLDQSKKEAECGFCGAKILINNENEYVYRIIDEARMRELEMKEREREEAERKREEAAQRTARDEDSLRLQKQKQQNSLAIGIICSVFLMLLGFATSGVTMLLGIVILSITISKYRKNREIEYIRAGMIRMPVFGETNAHALKAKLLLAGFTNVTLVNRGDIVIGIIKKKGEINEVTINGDRPIVNKWYDRDAPILIQYHGKAGE